MDGQWDHYSSSGPILEKEQSDRFETGVSNLNRGEIIMPNPVNWKIESWIDKKTGMEVAIGIPDRELSSEEITMVIDAAEQYLIEQSHNVAVNHIGL